MPIKPGLGQTSYSRNQGEQRKGRPATLTPVETYPAVNPILAQLGNVLFGGTEADGTYSTTIVDDVTGESVTVETVRSTTPANNDDLAAQHVIDIAASAALRNVVSAAVNGTTAEQVDLTFLHAGRTYTVTNSSPGGATLVWTESQAAGGAALNVARFVQAGAEIAGERSVQDLGASSLAADVVAFLLTPLAEIANPGSVLAAESDQYPAGSMVNAGYRGKVMAENVGGAGSQGGHVHVVINTAGGDELGEMRATAAGVQQVVDVEPVEANDTYYELLVNLVDLATGQVVATAISNVLSDASATETEIQVALKAHLDASELVTVWGVETGTDGAADDISLRLTAPLGYRIDAQTVGVGVITVTDATAGVPYTIRLPKSQAYLDQDIAAGATGRIYINLPRDSRVNA